MKSENYWKEIERKIKSAQTESFAREVSLKCFQRYVNFLLVDQTQEKDLLNKIENYEKAVAREKMSNKKKIVTKFFHCFLPSVYLID